MKKCILLFIVLSTIVFAESYELVSMNQYNKAVYNMEKKEPWGAVVGTFLLPTLGHAYAGDWGRGLKFLGGEIIAYYVICLGASYMDDYYSTEYQDDVYYDSPSGDGLLLMGLASLITIRIWEHIDAYKTAKNYNSNLYKRITLNPVLSLENNTAGVQLKYKF